MVKLRAFEACPYVCNWVTIWKGDTLRDLDKKDFAFFKLIYSDFHLSFCYYDDEDDNSICYSDDDDNLF